MAKANEEQTWDFPADADGPRPWRMEVKSAKFRPVVNGEGTLVEFGDTHLYGLYLEGPTMMLTADYEDDEEGKTPDDADFPIRSWTVGVFTDFADENEDGSLLTPKRKNNKPKGSFEFGQVLRSLVDLTSPEWLQANFGAWNVAASWEGHTIWVETKYQLNKKGEIIETKFGRQKTTTHIIGIDDTLPVVGGEF